MRWDHELTRLRDLALVRVRSATRLSPRELQRLRCSDIEQRQASGDLIISLGERPRRRMLELSLAAQEALLDWLEASRSWGAEHHLFSVGPGGEQLSLRGLGAALRRGES